MTSSLRIAMFSAHASPLAETGNESSSQHVTHLAKQLARQGHEVDVFTRRADTETPTLLRLADGVRLLQVQAGPTTAIAPESLLGYMPAFTDASRRMLLRADPYDLAHAHFFLSAQAALNLRPEFGWPVVVSFQSLALAQGPRADLFPAARTLIERGIVQHADRLVADSARDRAELMRLYDAPAPRIAVVSDEAALVAAYRDAMAEPVFDGMGPRLRPALAWAPACRMA